MNVIIKILILMFIIQNQVYSQWGLLRTMGLGGGIHFGYSHIDIEDMNKELKKFDLPEIESGILNFGGNFLISIGGIRAGLYGLGGSKSVESVRTYNSDTFISKIKMEESLLFGFVGYEIFNNKKFMISTDLGIGGGDYNFYITDKKTPSSSWEDVLQVPNSISNITRKLEYNFLSFQPSITFEYVFKNFMKLFLTGNYNFIINHKWIKDYEFELTNAPNINFNGFSIRTGISIGIFF